MLIMDLNQNMPKSAYRKLSNLKLFCNVFALYLNETLNPFSTNVPFMGKPGSWFLLAKCFKNTCGRVTFSVKMQVIDRLPECQETPCLK